MVKGEDCMTREKYEELTDEEIINRIKEKDNKAVDYILEKYKNLVRKKARTLYLMGADRDDLIQEGMIGLYKAIYDFNEKKDTSFFVFADLCISRQIYSAIKASNRQKNLPLNTYISIYTPLYNDDAEEEESGILVDSLLFNNNFNPEKLVIDKENINVLEYELVRRLSTLEKKVLKRYLNGQTYIDIAKELERSPKSIDNALQRIKSKLSALLLELKE